MNNTSSTQPLLDQSLSLTERLKIFKDLIEKRGFDPEIACDGKLDEHILSLALNLTPQVVIMYNNLLKCDKKELEILEPVQDIEIVKVLMLIPTIIREKIYQHLDRLLKDDYPLTRIIDFIENGPWRTRITDVYAKVSSNYWKQIASYLKDRNVVDGTINKAFRQMLFSIALNKASNSQLDWLERGIIHDYERGLGIFIRPELKSKFNNEIEIIEKFLADYEQYDLY